MSTYVDERVVEMSFDNRKFESNVKTSMGTIDKLKNSLDFSGTAKSLNRELNNVNVGGLSGAVMAAKNSFSAMEIVAIATLANITNRIIDLGIQMASSLSFDQIATGWNKFKEMAISEATLLAQGKSVEQVNEAMEDLLFFSDETSYSFSDMMANMSKFTAAGVDLKVAQEAMMGIANWAALSGQNADVASRAMLQLSQAMGSGVIRVKDWMSIENANMATAEFKKMVLETAVAAKKLEQNMDGTYTVIATGKTFTEGQFRDNLDEGFFTTDVLTTTLQYYSAAVEKVQKIMDDDSSIRTAADAIKVYEKEIQDLRDSYNGMIPEAELSRIEMMEFSIKAFKAAQEARTFSDAIKAVKDAVATGWLRIFTKIFGQVEEAKVLWTDLAGSLYDVFMDGMWTKIDILGVWADNGGRLDLFENTEENTGAFWNLFNAIKAIKDLIGNSWDAVFGLSQLATYDERINEAGLKLKTFTQNLKDFTSKLFLSREASAAITNVLTGLFSILKLVGKTILAVAKGFTPVFNIIGNAVMYVIGLLGEVGGKITEFTKKAAFFDAITNNLKAFFNAIIGFVKGLKILDGVKVFIDEFKKSFSNMFGDSNLKDGATSGIKTAITALGDAFRWFGDVLTKFIVPTLPKVLKMLGSLFGWIVGSVFKAVSYIGSFVRSVIEWTKTNEKFQNGLNSVKKALSSIGKAFDKAITSVSNFFSKFSTAKTKPVGDFADDTEKKFSPLSAVIKGLESLFSGLWHVVQSIIPVVGALFKFIGKALTTIGDKLKSIFTKSNGDINFAKIFSVGFWAVIAVGIYRFATMLRSITQVFRDALDGVFDYFNSKAMAQYMEAIKTMAISILLMVGALLILGSMDPKVLARSMLALTALIAYIVGVMLLLKKLVTGFSASQMMKGGLFKSIKQTITFSSNLAGLGMAFLGLGLAVLALATSLKIISKLDPDSLLRSLGVIAVMMVMLIGVMKMVGESDRETNKAVRSMVKVAVSIALLARPLKMIGSIDTTTGIKGLIGIALLMTILVGYSRYSRAIDKSQKPINGMISSALALTLLAIPLKMIGSIPINSLLKSFGAIIGIFALILTISKVMKLKDTNRLAAISTQLSIVAGGLAAFGIAMLLIGMSSWKTVRKTLSVLAGSFIILRYITRSLTPGDAKNLSQLTYHLAIIAGGLAAFGFAMILIGMNGWETVLKTITTIGIVLSSMVIMSKVMKPEILTGIASMTKKLLVIALGLGAFGAAMLVIGSNSWENIGKAAASVVGLLISFASLSFILKKMGPVDFDLQSLGLSLASISIGMILFGVAIKTIGSLDIPTIAKGIGAIIVALAALGLVSVLFAQYGITAAIAGLAGAFLMFSAAVFILAAGLTMLVTVLTVSSVILSAGLIAIAKAIVIAAPAIIEAVKVLSKGLLEAFYGLIPTIVDGFITLMVALLEALVFLAPKIGDALYSLAKELQGYFKRVIRLILNNLADILIDAVEFIIQFVKRWFTSIYEEFNTLVPFMANLAFDIIISFLNGFGEAIDSRAVELREAVIGLCMNITSAVLKFFGVNTSSEKLRVIANQVIGGFIKGITDTVSLLVSKVNELLVPFFVEMYEKASEMVSIGAAYIDEFLRGMVSIWFGVNKWFNNKLEEIKSIFKSFTSSAITIGSDMITSIKVGAENAWFNVNKWFNEKAESIKTTFKNIVKSFKTIGEDMIKGMVEGIADTWDQIPDLLANLGGSAVKIIKDVLGIKSPSKVFAEIGRFLDLGLVQGIKGGAGLVYNAAGQLAEDTIDEVERSGISEILSNLNRSLQSDFDNQIVIQPVLDLSEIQNGKKRLFDMMNSDTTYDIGNGSSKIAISARDNINKKVRSSSPTSDDSNSETLKTSQTNENTYNTFNISGSDPKAIADEVSKVLQNQVDRRKAKWAL
jgi:phage-related protein